MAGYWESLASSRVARRRLLGGAAAFSVGAAALAVAGCGDDGEEDTGSTTSNGSSGSEAVQGGSLGRNSTASDHFNILTNYGEAYHLAGLHVYDRLIGTRVAGKDAYVLEAAESVEVASPTRIVFKLKPNLVYQNKPPVNGRAVKASDIVATQIATRDEPAAENSFQRNSMERVEAPDDRTIVFTLKGPNAYLFTASQLGHPGNQSIIPTEMLQSNLNTTPPVGSGPYELAEYTLGTRYVYRRNPRYRDADKKLPYIDERVVLPLTDLVALEAAFRSGQLQYWYNAPPAGYDRVMKDMGSQITSVEYLSLAPINLLMCTAGDRPWIKDARIREAFIRSINRAQVRDLVFTGQGVVPPGHLSAGLEAYQLTAAQADQYTKQDLAKAKQLLSAANVQGRNFDAMTGTGVGQQTAEVVATQMLEVGVNLRFASIPFNELVLRARRGEFDVYAGAQPNFDSPMLSLRQAHSDTRSSWENTGLRDPEIDSLIEKSETIVDRDDHIKAVKDIQLKLLQKFSPVYNLHTRNIRDAIHARVQDFQVDPSQTTRYLEAWIKPS